MSRYPNEDVARFDQQFAKTTEERNSEYWRRRARQHQRAIETLQHLIADMSSGLCDEGCDYSVDGLDQMRRRVANALPPTMCPEWLTKYRDPPLARDD